MLIYKRSSRGVAVSVRRGGWRNCSDVFDIPLSSALYTDSAMHKTTTLLRIHDQTDVDLRRPLHAENIENAEALRESILGDDLLGMSRKTLE
jgi:hypothetical protein